MGISICEGQDLDPFMCGIETGSKIFEKKKAWNTLITNGVLCYF
jgi:hypothetical protein